MSPQAPFVAPDRDEAYKGGRAVGAGVTYDSLPGVACTGVTTMVLTANTDYYGPFRLRTSRILDRLRISVTAAAGNCRFGIYRANASLQPFGAPMVDSGVVDTSGTGVKTYSPSPTIWLPRGRYVTVINASAGPTLRATQGNYIDGVHDFGVSGGSVFAQEMTVSRTFAAFPTPGTAWDTVVMSGSPTRYPVGLRFSTG